MKDAKGHGSDPKGAHAEGVDQIGQPKTYTWAKGLDGVHRLASGNEPPIASVFKPGTEKPPLSGGPVPKGYYYGQLHKDFNTGAGKSGSWGLLGSVQSAKGWVERKSANSWDAPNISNPTRRG